MKRSKKHISFLLILALMLLALSACGKKEEPQDEPEELSEDIDDVEDMDTIANPFKKVTHDELVTATGINIDAPEGATDVEYFTITFQDGTVMGEVDFKFDGLCFYYRAVYDDDLEATDTSGVYLENPEQTATTVDYCDAILLESADGAVIYWCDKVPGIDYSLSSIEQNSGEQLMLMANKCFVPAQGEVDGD